jgi:hypothetical protein
MSEVGRYAPCPCGSGRKYKRCCLGRAPAVVFTAADREAALRRLIEFSARPEFEEERLLASTAFWSDWLRAHGESEGRRAMDLEQSTAVFATWFAIDFRLISGATLLELLQRRQATSLGRGEREYLERMRGTHLRAYQVTDVKLDEGLRLIDLWSGEQVWVQERVGTRQLVRWDLLAVRLMQGASGTLVMDGLPYLYPVGSKDVLLKNLRRFHRDFKRRAPFGGLTDFFRRMGPMFHYLWLETVALRPLPKLVTAEGDPLVFARAIFDVLDREALLAALDSHADLDRDDDGSHAWLETAPASGAASAGS